MEPNLTVYGIDCRLKTVTQKQTDCCCREAQMQYKWRQTSVYLFVFMSVEVVQLGSD